MAREEGSPTPTEKKVAEVLSELRRRGDLIGIRGVHDVFCVDVPFASAIPISDEQIVQEANPFAVFSYLTALAYHGLTDTISNVVYATHYTTEGLPTRLPLGTQPEDWAELPLPTPKLPKEVGKTAVDWSRVKGEWDFGHLVGFSQGLPIYVTDVERTLLDALRSPDKSGGLLVVLRAWKNAVSAANLDRLVGYVDRVDRAIDRQRVGYIIEALGHAHPRLEYWRQRLLRGSSLKLLASAPYATKFSERWNISLNVPESVLDLLKHEG